MRLGIPHERVRGLETYLQHLQLLDYLGSVDCYLLEPVGRLPLSVLEITCLNFETIKLPVLTNFSGVLSKKVRTMLPLAFCFKLTIQYEFSL
jgi:hypothetical protein